MKNSAEKVEISLRAPAATIDAFDRIAKILDRDRSWVMLQAFSFYLRGEGDQILDEAEGVAELDRGDSVDFDEAMDDIDKLVSEAQA